MIPPTPMEAAATALNGAGVAGQRPPQLSRADLVIWCQRIGAGADIERETLKLIGRQAAAMLKRDAGGAGGSVEGVERCEPAENVYIPALFTAYAGQQNEDARVFVMETNGKGRVLYVRADSLRTLRDAACARAVLAKLTEAT